MIIMLHVKKNKVDLCYSYSTANIVPNTIVFPDFSIEPMIGFYSHDIDTSGFPVYLEEREW